MKYLTTLALLAGFTAAAQPTLTSVCNHVLSETYVHHDCDSVFYGPSGANVTWDFSSLQINTNDTFSVAACPGDPDCGTYPGTNLVVACPALSYKGFTIEDANRYSANGTSSGAAYSAVYADPEDLLRYPLTYNDHFTDSFNETIMTPLDTTLRLGADSNIADAWGTLILPSGSFPNALRIHRFTSYKDSSITNGQVHLYSQESYSWYILASSGFKMVVNQPLFKDGNPIAGATVITSDPLSLQAAQLHRNDNISLYPNPAREQLTLTGASGEITVYNTLGQLLMGTEATGNTGTLNTVSLAPGIYYLSIRDTKTGRTQRLKFLKE